jgi:branched-chain amino acid transport system permease protein
MTELLSFTILGLFTGAAYAIAASGLVLTYTTTRVFNLAHGAIGMVMSFVYWQLSVSLNLPTWLSLVLVLLIIAPAFGILIERVMMRGLGNAPVSVGLVVTVGLFVGLIGLAQAFWPPQARTVPEFFGTGGAEVGTAFVSYHQLMTILLAALVAGGLYALLNRTRVGVSMRAAVDNPALLELYGGRPQRVSMVSWAIGASSGALAGILLAPVVSLDYYQLTLLVINAYAAAMLGRLRSLPLTFVGAMVLGLLQAYAIGYLPSSQTMIGLRAVIPTLMLFLVLLFAPQARLRVGQVKGIVSAPVPTLRRCVTVGVVLIVAAAGGSALLPTTSVMLAGIGLIYAIVMLSLVLLTGYGGHVSLAQLTFLGIGAVTAAKLATPSPWALIVAALTAAGVGALVSLPVLRLTGLYLALSTLAFGQLMDKLVFQAPFVFGFNGSLNAPRVTILGLRVGTERGYLVLIAVVFVLMAIALLALRRGRVGRLLIAMRDSPAACGTLGLNLRWFRVGLFAASAGIAGLAGALFAGLRETIGATDFQVMSSLPLLLLAVVCGVTSATGALFGGFLLMLLPVVQASFPALGGLVFLVIGFGAVSLGRDPNGLANLAFKVGRWVRHARGAAGVVGRGRDDLAPGADADAITGEEVSSYDAA